jgi:phosphopantetheinyl transferase (holo-ACP synthase)
VLSGKALELMQSQGVTRLMISLTHTSLTAQAIVLAVSA